MPNTNTVIIGGGQAGLAMSRCLTDHGIEHVVLERGRVGERWRSERWDSLRLLTPRWMSRIAGWSHPRDDLEPNGFMSGPDFVRYMEQFAESFVAPVHTGVTVTSVHSLGEGYRIQTDRGLWTAANVVIATGQSQKALVPDLAADVDTSVHQIAPTEYKNPDGLPHGGVLVVGASATGIQLAAEIHASGRPVTLSVGRHTRLPRTYRGRDILEWFEHMGILDERAADVRNLTASRNQPSMQLIGSPDRRPLDLGILQAAGIRLLGRAKSADRWHMRFEDDLIESIAASELKLAGLRLRIDQFIREEGLADQVGPAEPFVPVPLPDSPTSLDLRAAGIRSVLWATGFRRSYPWLRVPVLDARGEVVHSEGITASPGLYILGLNFMKRRSSSFIGGVAQDAEELAAHLVRSRTSRTHASRRAVA